MSCKELVQCLLWSHVSSICRVERNAFIFINYSRSFRFSMFFHFTSASLYLGCFPIHRPFKNFIEFFRNIYQLFLFIIYLPIFHFRIYICNHGIWIWNMRLTSFLTSSVICRFLLERREWENNILFCYNKGSHFVILRLLMSRTCYDHFYLQFTKLKIGP